MEYEVLDFTAQKGRYGPSYIQSACLQSGYSFVENNPDEDKIAIDGNIQLDIVSAPVQIKCTSELSENSTGEYYPYYVSNAMKEKWEKQIIPPYFILVKIYPQDPDGNIWITHPSDRPETVHHSEAYWVKIEKDCFNGNTIHIPKKQKFTSSTILDWRKELLESFSTHE